MITKNTLISIIDTACQSQAFGKCSQLCQLSNTSGFGYTCSCIDGYTIQNDQMTCLANGKCNICMIWCKKQIGFVPPPFVFEFIFYAICNVCVY